MFFTHCGKGGQTHVWHDWHKKVQIFQYFCVLASEVPNVAVFCKLRRWIRPIRRLGWVDFLLTPTYVQTELSLNWFLITAQLQQQHPAANQNWNQLIWVQVRPLGPVFWEFRSVKLIVAADCCNAQLLSCPDRGRGLNVLELLEVLRIGRFEDLRIWGWARNGSRVRRLGTFLWRSGQVLQTQNKYLIVCFVLCFFLFRHSIMQLKLIQLKIFCPQ